MFRPATNGTKPSASRWLIAGVDMAVTPSLNHDDVKWKQFQRYWTFVSGFHRSPVDFPHKGQWRRALMFSLICAWTNGWAYNRDAGDLRRHRAHYGATVMNEAERGHSGFRSSVVYLWTQSRNRSHVCHSSWIAIKFGWDMPRQNVSTDLL